MVLGTFSRPLRSRLALGACFAFLVAVEEALWGGLSGVGLTGSISWRTGGVVLREGGWAWRRGGSIVHTAGVGAVGLACDEP